ncbi:hypothetical protein FOPG_11741 [Fusarium oxysporum f. sp. conglutinans race 2 54008]|uniref:Uncharacterized protein n=1 Tax=Fusarium oxysporum f. sp. conglutinans race 2 54008 TaxID=1089457 RepID=X0HMJ7_FUSOX|nr:hypothetical protein FOPG_11741 [Fusarium oxysporum f. sp. conglutinans race 2 54008]KAI8403656.1 hypothetical protein FOFC_17098 [Fusarium oxysporum]
MYIPISSPHLQAARRHGTPAILHPLTKPFSHISPYPTLIRRQFSDNPTTNNNIKIGLIVGFTLAAFLAIVITFLYFYYRSARFTFRKKKHRRHHHHHHHHHRRHKSMSSGGSRHSDRSAAPADDAPPPPPDKPADG